MKRVLNWRIEKEVEWFIFCVLVMGLFCGFMMYARIPEQIAYFFYYLFLFSPMITAFFFMLYDTELLKKVIMNIFSAKAVLWSLIGITLMFLANLLTYFILARTGAVRADSILTHPSLEVILNIFKSLVIKSILPGVFIGLGEEVGWRGFLQHKLSQRHRFSVTMLYVSVVWFIWHLPVIAYKSGYNLSAIIYYSIFFLLIVVGMTVILGVFFRITESVLVTSLMHVSNNVFQRYFSKLIYAKAGLSWAPLLCYGAVLVIISFIFIGLFNKNLSTLNIFKLRSKT